MNQINLEQYLVVRPSIVYFYTTIDLFAYLYSQRSVSERTGKREYKQFIDVFLPPLDKKSELTPEGIYDARCGIVHNLRVINPAKISGSKNGSIYLNNGDRKILYSIYDPPQVDPREMNAYKMYGAIFITLPTMLKRLKESINKFQKHLANLPEDRILLIKKKAGHCLPAITNM